MQQIYSQYTAEDQEVWQILFNRQIKDLPPIAASDYLQGLEDIQMKAEKIPDFTESNALLRDLTGWEMAAVGGIVEDKKFFDLLKSRKFPATTWLRKKSQLDYLEEPDMFHDVFGHVPLLTNSDFVGFLQAFSEMGQTWMNNHYATAMLSRIYWYTVEFGLMRENDQVKIYGAGIMSSSQETFHSLSDAPEQVDFSVDGILDTPFRNDIIQQKYFVIESLEQLYRSIPEFRSKIEERLKFQGISKFNLIKAR